MRLLARCLVVVMLSAGSAVASSTETSGTGPDIAASGRKAPARESREPLGWPAIDESQAASADAAIDNGGVPPESRKLARPEEVPRDGMFLLFLQILRSPK